MRLTFLCRRFVENDRGAIAMVFAAVLLVISLTVAMSIDMARSSDVKTRVQAALDAAALAGIKFLFEENMPDAAVQEKAKAYFEEQLTRESINDVTISKFKLIANRADKTVTTRADVAIGSMFNDLSGNAKGIKFTPESTATAGSISIEASLVLDVTGSMCDVAPYVGEPPCTGAKLNALKAAASDLITSLADVSRELGSVRVGMVPYSASVNAGAYAGAVSGGASWDGCVVERDGAGAFPNAPPSTQPMGVITPGSIDFYSCVPSPILPLMDLASEAQRTALLGAINSLTAFGGTAGHIGAAWGWYLLSPEWKSVFGPNAGRAWKPEKVHKVVIFMTDGMFNVSYFNGGQDNAWPSPSSSDPSVPGTSGNQALRLCEEMKSADDPLKVVHIYTIAFEAPPEAEQMLKQCSGEKNFYDAKNSGQLSKAFREIGQQLKDLRVSK